MVLDVCTIMSHCRDTVPPPIPRLTVEQLVPSLSNIMCCPYWNEKI